jgi:hypothetical protein
MGHRPSPGRHSRFSKLPKATSKLAIAAMTVSYGINLELYGIVAQVTEIVNDLASVPQIVRELSFGANCKEHARGDYFTDTRHCSLR